MINFSKGDVFKAKEEILIHGCNCFNTMGAGIAKQIKIFYPGAWEADQSTTSGDKDKLGNFTFWSGKHYYYDQDIIVVNLYTQYYYGGKHSIYDDVFEYDYFRNALEQLEFVFRGNSIAMPKIGAGLANGNWDRIERIIYDVFDESDCNINIYHLD